MQSGKLFLLKEGINALYDLQFILGFNVLFLITNLI